MKTFYLIVLMHFLLFDLEAIGGELPQPAPCDIQFDDGSIVYARLCVDVGQKTVASLCDGKICQISHVKNVYYRISSQCGVNPTFSVNPELYYKYPFEVFVEHAGEKFSGKNLKTPRIKARILSSTAEAVSIELRNPGALNRLVNSLNEDFSAHSIAVRVLKLKAYPVGTVFFQRTLTGFKKVEQKNDLMWDQCSADKQIR